MSEHTDDINQDDLGRMLAALHKLLHEHEGVMQEVRVLVRIPENVRAARVSSIIEATGKGDCEDGCPPGTECMLDPFTLEWFCD